MAIVSAMAATLSALSFLSGLSAHRGAMARTRADTGVAVANNGIGQRAV
jgi:hypothetical protein